MPHCVPGGAAPVSAAVQGPRRWGRGPLPSAGGPFWNRRRLAPARWFPARSRAGIQAFSRESPDAKSRGGMPPAPPFFRARSFPLARFGVVGRSGAVVGLLRGPCTCPDLETFFHKMLFQHIFPENASQIGVRISDEIAPPPDQRQRSQKRASGSKRAIKPGVQGACPRPSFSPFLGRNGDPRRAGGATGRCAPRLRKSPTHPKGTLRDRGPLLQGPLLPPGGGQGKPVVHGSRPLPQVQHGPQGTGEVGLCPTDTVR